MIVLQEAYRKRPIRFLELWEQRGWRLKVYGIAYQGEYPRAHVIEKAKELASERLPQLVEIGPHLFLKWQAIPVEHLLIHIKCQRLPLN